MAATTTSLLLLASGVKTTADLSAAYGQSRALGAQSRIARLNASQSELQAQDAIRRGELASHAQLRGTRAMIGAQRASLAAQGVDVSAGSAAELQRQAADYGAQDASMLRMNAFREAMGFRSQAYNQIAQGRAYRQMARSTLVTGGIGVARDVAQGIYEYKQDPWFLESSREEAKKKAKT